MIPSLFTYDLSFLSFFKIKFFTVRTHFLVIELLVFLFCSFLPNCVQESELLKPTVLAADLGVRNVSTMPAPKKLVHQASNEMPPPPPRTMPPPPPKFTSSTQVVKEIDENNVLNKTKSDDVPGILEYTLFLLVLQVLKF